MAHGPRRMSELKPGLWLVRCQWCPRAKAKLPSARDCHEWWQEHEATERHRAESDPERRDEARAKRAIDRRALEGFFQSGGTVFGHASMDSLRFSKGEQLAAESARLGHAIRRERRADDRGYGSKRAVCECGWESAWSSGPETSKASNLHRREALGRTA